MVLLGCRPPGRNTEQHDIFFGIGETLKDLVPVIKKSWPGTKGNIHIDAWRKVTHVDGHHIIVTAIQSQPSNQIKIKELFFINLGGYKENEFDEFHYKVLVAAPGKKEAIQLSKQTAFFKHTSIQGARSHIDDKFGVDVDDVYEIKDILSGNLKKQYRISVSPEQTATDDIIHLGYFKLNSFQ